MMGRNGVHGTLTQRKVSNAPTEMGCENKGHHCAGRLYRQTTGEMCTAHQISQVLCYQWRDALLANAAHAFAVHQHNRREAHLEQENTKLKPLISELLMALKRSDEP